MENFKQSLFYTDVNEYTTISRHRTLFIALIYESISPRPNPKKFKIIDTKFHIRPKRFYTYAKF